MAKAAKKPDERILAVDVVIENHGSIVTFRPLSDQAKQWFDENVASESWQWLGNALGVDHRFAGDLADGLINEGFEVA